MKYIVILLSAIIHFPVYGVACAKLYSSPGYDETVLRTKSLRPVYTNGLDKMKVMLELGGKLRSLYHRGTLKPRDTHIPELVDTVYEAIQFIERGIRKQGLEVRDRLKLLEQLKREFHSQKSVLTYNWYAKFMFRLTILATTTNMRRNWIPEKGFDWVRGEDPVPVSRLNMHERSASYDTELYGDILEFYETVNKKFPDHIYLPIASPFGLISLNTGKLAEHIVPLEVDNKKSVADGLEMVPIEKFLHDRVDNDSFFVPINTRRKARLLYQYIQAKAGTLGKEEREAVELVFFLFTHEENSWLEFKRGVFKSRESGGAYTAGGAEPGLSHKNRVRNHITEGVLHFEGRFSDPLNYGPLLPPDLNVNSQSIKNYLKRVAAVFFEVTEGFFDQYPYFFDPASKMPPTSEDIRSREATF